MTNNRVFRVNLASNQAVFKMHALLLNTSASNLEVSVEPERGFSFMNATKTISRNRIREKQLNNLMLVGLHSPSVCAAASDARVHEELEAFISLCMKEWDSVKGRRCRSKLYNNDKDKQKVERKTRTRQQSLEASSFAVLATVKAKKKKKEEEEVGEHAQAEGCSVSKQAREFQGYQDVHACTVAVVTLGYMCFRALPVCMSTTRMHEPEPDTCITFWVVVPEPCPAVLLCRRIRNHKMSGWSRFREQEPGKL